MPMLAQWQRNEDNAGMNIIARILFVAVIWTVTYMVADASRTPVPSWYEPTE